MHKRVFLLTEFCARYAIGRTKAYEEIASGRLRAVKLGRRTLVTQDDAEAWLAALPASASRNKQPTADELAEKVDSVAILTMPADTALESSAAILSDPPVNRLPVVGASLKRNIQRKK